MDVIGILHTIGLRKEKAFPICYHKTNRDMHLEACWENVEVHSPIRSPQRRPPLKKFNQKYNNKVYI